MARYCISYKTMELFFDIGGAETVPELVSPYVTVLSFRTGFVICTS